MEAGTVKDMKHNVLDAPSTAVTVGTYVADKTPPALVSVGFKVNAAASRGSSVRVTAGSSFTLLVPAVISTTAPPFACASILSVSLNLLVSVSLSMSRATTDTVGLVVSPSTVFVCNAASLSISTTASPFMSLTMVESWNRNVSVPDVARVVSAKILFLSMGRSLNAATALIELLVVSTVQPDNFTLTTVPRRWLVCPDAMVIDPALNGSTSTLLRTRQGHFVRVRVDSVRLQFGALSWSSVNVFGVDLSDVWMGVILLSAASLTKSSVGLSIVSACFVAKGALLLIPFKSSLCTVMVIVLESADIFAVDFFVNANDTVVSAPKKAQLGDISSTASETASVSVPPLISKLYESTFGFVASFVGSVVWRSPEL